MTETLELSEAYPAKWQGTCRKCLFDISVGASQVRVTHRTPTYAESWYLHEKCT